MAKVLRYETETCSRCHGSGHYSSCERLGTLCRKCLGSGRQNTRKARKAIDAAAALVASWGIRAEGKFGSQDVGRIQPGAIVSTYRMDGRTMWRTVAAVEQLEAHTYPASDGTTHVICRVRLTFTDGTSDDYDSRECLRRKFNAAEHAARFALLETFVGRGVIAIDKPDTEPAGEGTA